MPRQISGKEHVGESRITRKSGITYVYKHMTRYNPETRKTVTVSSKLESKIMPGGSEVVSMLPHRPNGTGRLQAARQHVD